MIFPLLGNSRIEGAYFNARYFQVAFNPCLYGLRIMLNTTWYKRDSANLSSERGHAVHEISEFIECGKHGIIGLGGPLNIFRLSVFRKREGSGFQIT